METFTPWLPINKVQVTAKKPSTFLSVHGAPCTVPTWWGSEWIAKRVRHSLQLHGNCLLIGRQIWAQIMIIQGGVQTELTWEEMISVNLRRGNRTASVGQMDLGAEGCWWEMGSHGARE